MSFVDFYNRSKRVIDEIVDKTYAELNLSTDPLNTAFPIIDYASTSLLLLDIVRKPTVGTIVASGDIPATKPITEITEREMKRLGIGKRYEFGSEDLEAMKEFELYLASQGNVAPAAIEQFKAYFWGIAADLIPAMRRKQYILMLKLATQGSVTYTDPLSEVVVRITYPDTIPTLLPATLTAGNLWSAATTANGLLNLESLAEAWYDEFYSFPTTLMIRRRDLLALRRQDSTKAAMASAMSQNLDASQVGDIYVKEDVVVNLIKERTKVRDVVVMDAQYYEENPDDPRLPTAGHYLDDGVITFLEEGNNFVASIPSVENDWQPGVKVLAEREKEVPRRESITGYQRVIPAIKDSRKISAQKVN
jgi:hypothetical protein